MSQNEGEAEAQQEVDATEAEVTDLKAETKEVQETTDWKAKYEETEGRLRRAETKLEKSKIEKKAEAKAEAIVKEKTGELDETQLDYLDLKGINEPEDIDAIQKVMLKTGMTVRQALKDDYVQSRLTALKAGREVKSATPSSTKRGGNGGGSDLAIALAKYEQSGYKDLPADFALRSAVVNATADKTNPNKPSWRR